MKYFFFLLLFAVMTQVASAAEYAVTPLLIENTVEPRDIFEETVKITNTSNRKIRIFPTVNAITVGDEGEVRSFVPASMSDNSTSVTSWISVTRGRVEINPNETIKIPVSFAINPSAEAGEYYAFVGFAEGSKRDEVDALVISGQAPGVVVRLSIVEKRNEYLRLNLFNINRFITSDRIATVSYQLENIGGLPIVPLGEIIFYDARGVEVTSIPVNPERKEIKPGSNEKFEQTIPYLGIIGRHKALLNIEYGTTQRANLYDTAYFNVVPLVYLVLSFVIMLLGSIMLALYYNKKRNKLVVDQGDVSMYVRSGIVGIEKDHDINLKK